MKTKIEKRGEPISADAEVQAAIKLLLDYLVYCDFENFVDDANERGCVWHAVRVAGEWLDLDFTDVDRVIRKELEEKINAMAMHLISECYSVNGPQSPMRLSPEQAGWEETRSGWRSCWWSRWGAAACVGFKQSESLLNGAPSGLRIFSPPAYCVIREEEHND